MTLGKEPQRPWRCGHGAVVLSLLAGDKGERTTAPIGNNYSGHDKEQECSENGIKGNRPEASIKQWAQRGHVFLEILVTQILVTQIAQYSIESLPAPVCQLYTAHSQLASLFLPLR